MEDPEKQSIPVGSEDLSILANDLLEGADEIAEFLYGDRKKRRKVYYLAQKRCLPFFKIGEMICARRSRLRARIEELETEAMEEEG